MTEVQTDLALRRRLVDAMALIADWRDHSKDAEDKALPDDVRQAQQFARGTLGALQEGDTDPWTGRTIHSIVRKSTRYVVFLDEDLELQWWWMQRPENPPLLARIQAEVARLEHESGFLRGGGRSWNVNLVASWTRAPSSDHNDTLRSVRMLIGEALAIALNRGATAADCEATLKRAAETIAQSKEQYCRPTFFYAFSTAVGVLGLALWWMLQPMAGERVIGNGFTPLLAMQAAFCGALGAFVSAMVRMRSLNLEPFAGRRGVVIDALARALIGAIAGVLVVLAYESGLVLKAAVDAKAAGASDVAFALKMFIALVAGLSERILPSLVARGEVLITSPTPATSTEPRKEAREATGSSSG